MLESLSFLLATNDLLKAVSLSYRHQHGQTISLFINEREVEVESAWVIDQETARTYAVMGEALLGTLYQSSATEDSSYHLARFYAESLVEGLIHQDYLEQTEAEVEGGARQEGLINVLNYRVGQKGVRRVLDNVPTDYGELDQLYSVLVALKSMRQGFRLIETPGLCLAVKTPGGLVRELGQNECGCPDYHGYRKVKCRHLRLAEVYSRHRPLFDQHGLVEWKG